MKEKYKKLEGITGLDIKISILETKDIEEIADMLENPKVAEYLYFAPAPREVFIGYFEPLAKQIKEDIKKTGTSKTMVFVMRDEKTNELIGNCGILEIPMVEGVYEVGYQIREEYWGKGIGTKICELLVEYGVEELNAHRLEANLYENNIGSRKILEKNNFVHEGTSKKYYKLEDGKYIGKMNFGLIK